MGPYLYRRHLGIASPAEALKLQRVVAKPDGTTIHHGTVLNLILHVVQVWEVVIGTRPT